MNQILVVQWWTESLQSTNP